MMNSNRSAGFSLPYRRLQPATAEVALHHRGYLPHLEKSGAVYSVTFRLADSMPQAVYQELKDEKLRAIKAIQAMSGGIAQIELARISESFSERFDAYLGKCHGACALRNLQAAEIVADVMHFVNADRHRLYAWCVMPNHVHAVLEPLGDSRLSDILRSWKGSTARQVNQIVGRTGPLWQRESYDHVIRNEEELVAKIRYVLDNAAKAGLKDWRWYGTD